MREDLASLAAILRSLPFSPSVILLVLVTEVSPHAAIHIPLFHLHRLRTWGFLGWNRYTVEWCACRL